MKPEVLEAALELLDKANMLGMQDNMDDELKRDIVESFMHTGYLKVEDDTLVYHDQKHHLTYDLKTHKIL